MEEKERYIKMFENCIEDDVRHITYCVDDRISICRLLNKQDKEIQQLKQQLEESEKQVKHWHDLYKERDRQFQSVRQRYHLLNKLQSNYDKKDKLHLAYMQCAELIEENDKLKQQLHDLPKKIVKEIKEKQPIFTENSYGFTTKQGWDMCVETLDTILKKFGGENE